jgi:hypothetical protein
MIDLSTPCIPYTGYVGRDGYGLVLRPRGRAHRAAYEQARGPIPAGYFLDHVCHNADPTCPGGSRGDGTTCLHRRCINPAHLEVVTPRENSVRGRTLGAINVAKTHCPQGHPYDEANTYRFRSAPGERFCVTCTRARARERGRRVRAARRAAQEKAA